jgi:hypothetical protein
MEEKIKILIEAGAEVDRKGAVNKILWPPVDAMYQDYFRKEGSRPIDFAIKKNLPTIVDLLLPYSKLGITKESVKTAKESGDPAMAEKIMKLWEEQKHKKK